MKKKNNITTMGITKDLYCHCCGRDKSSILTDLIQKEWTRSNGRCKMKTDGTHFLYEIFKNTIFSKDNDVRFCPECGTKIDEELKERTIVEVEGPTTQELRYISLVKRFKCKRCKKWFELTE